LDPDHLQEVESWRRGRVERLTSPGGYLTLVGLTWLEPGPNRFGSAPDNEVRLPEGAAPAHVGTFFLEGDRVRVQAEAGAELTLDGEPVAERELTKDIDGEPDILQVRDLKLYVIQRADAIGVRVKDPNSVARREFRGIEYFPVDSSYRMRVPLQRYEPPREMVIPSALGPPQVYTALGEIELEHGGERWTMVPVTEGGLDGQEMFFIFGDLTNGVETFGWGRFLYGTLHEDDTISLDFNRAYNPPCAFSPHSTCPLPPPENRLAVRIEAGERAYERH
jgi:uncharacterized protein (DUF1684 family)